MKRISSFMPTDNMQYFLRNREARLNELNNRMATQSRIKDLRDDPLAAGRSVRFKSEMERLDRYGRNVELVKGHMSVTEGYLKEAVDVLQRVHELAVQGANGVYSKDQTGMMAEEVDQLLHELLTIGNAKSEEGLALFAGNLSYNEPFKVSTGPVDGAPIEKVVSVDYVGNIGRNQAEIAEGATMPINLPGNYAFWAENQQLYSSVDATSYRVQEDAAIRLDGEEINLKAGDNIYAIINKINNSRAPLKASLDPTKNALVLETTTPHQIWPEDLRGGRVLQDLGLINDRFTSPPYNLANSARAFGGSIFDMVIYLRDKLYTGDVEELGSAALRGIQDALNSMTGAVGELGARYSRLDLNAQRIDYEKPEIQQMDSREVDLDLSEAITELKMLDYTHQAALATTAKILQPTLLDFLR